MGSTESNTRLEGVRSRTSKTRRAARARSQVPSQEGELRAPGVDAALTLLATALEHRRFSAAATAFLSELTLTLHCEQASLGLVRGKRVELVGTSQGERSTSSSETTRAVEGAMGECVDRRTVIQHPVAHCPDQLNEQLNARVALKHAELAGAIGKTKDPKI